MERVLQPEHHVAKSRCTPDGGEDAPDADVNGGDAFTYTIRSDTTGQVADVEVCAAYDDIDRLERTDVKLRHRRTYTPLFQWPLLAAVVLLLLELLVFPGFGVAGGAGILSLALFFGSHLLLGLAGWEEVLLLGVGLIALGVLFLVHRWRGSNLIAVVALLLFGGWGVHRHEQHVREADRLARAAVEEVVSAVSVQRVVLTFAVEQVIPGLTEESVSAAVTD